MKLLLVGLGAVIASVVIIGLVLPRDASAQDRTLTLFGRVKGESVPDGHAELAFNFYDKETKVLEYRSVSTAVVKDGTYTASLRADELEEGKEYYVLATLPAKVPESFEAIQYQLLGIVLLQSSTPGIQQTGHVNISGTLIAGVIKTNAFQMSTGAASGHVLTSDASGNGTWQAPPPPSGAAGGDLSGTYPNPLVDGLQGWAVANTAPSSGQVLKWIGNAWSPGNDLQDAFWQASGNNIFYNAGKVGIGASSPLYPLHVVTGTGDRTIYGLHTATSGETYGGWFQNNSTSGTGVYGYATAAGSGASGFGVYGRSDSPNGRGVYGRATGFFYTFGVYGQSSSTSGTGVYGIATSTSGGTVGGWFESNSTGGIGVYARATATSGSNIGLIAQSSSSSGYGVYCSGSLVATGTKSFQMDHPFSPGTHYLNHFCTEGPEPYNAYSGNVVTDAQGYATVQLPDYFESINRDFRYQLTCIGQFAQAIVAEEIQNNRFVIRTDKPHVKVSWRVEAVRNDLRVQKYGFKTEQEKPVEHWGKYLDPELYGMPKEYGIYYRPKPREERTSSPRAEAKRVVDEKRR